MGSPSTDHQRYPKHICTHKLGKYTLLIHRDMIQTPQGGPKPFQFNISKAQQEINKFKRRRIMICYNRSYLTLTKCFSLEFST
jgi:hypothetical protein